MKHRGPASSLHPAREAARAQERGSLASSLPSTTTAVAAGAAVFGDWTVTTDEHGRLVGDHADGTRHVLATPQQGDDV